ncbi:AfsR/SARP family transcriptional regulator [Pedococcus sp. 5OH_020]|uniref:AfsR/SARP family transcriptional regulator n=1 Tax=Pedococcus sp. 5OH_020 TaxID=2989814 RepID=UPI0022EA0D62|nr:BTAD domain-containing putative transcriptional regulator [Pedococcus sp. 5OH_020]
MGLLGPVEVTSSGRTMAVSAPMQRAVLARLAVARNHGAHVNRLTESLWAAPPSQAVNLVQQYVSALRRTLGAESIVTSGRGYRLVADPDGVDSEVFRRLLAQAQGSRSAGNHHAAAELVGQALALHRGEPLADLPDCPFLEPARASLEALVLKAQTLSAAVANDLGHFAAAVDQASALVADHPLDEAAAVELMRALVGAGRQADSLAVYDRVRKTLAHELGLDPGPALREAQIAVLTQDPSFAPPGGQLRAAHAEALTHSDPVAVGPSPLAGRNTLPRNVDELIGRAADLHRIEALLQGHAVQLVTLIGPGGVGKTRLAVELASRASQRRDVVYVALDEIRSPELVLPAIAAALQLRLSGEDDLALRVGAALRRRDVLLVLDNFEHVILAAPALASVLTHSGTSMQILVTSRESLRIRGEHVYRVDPLPTVPEPDSAEPAPAVALFLNRAAAAGRDYGADQHRPAIVGICERLDGLPLAIELAAARTNVLDPVSILERLGQRLSLLTVGVRDAPDRQRSLRACLEWSVSLITDQERLLLAIASVFHAGAGIDSLEAVARAISPELDVLSLADSLVAKNLLVGVDEGKNRRITLLETIREYAGELLGALGFRAAAELAHADYYYRLLRTDLARPTRPPRDEAESRLFATEVGNARAALGALSRIGDNERAATLLCSMSLYLISTGSGAEFETLAAPLVTDAALVDPVRRAELRVWSSRSATGRGDHALAMEQLQQALPLVSADSSHPDPMVEAIVHLYLADAAERRGDARARSQELERARSAAQESDSEELPIFISLWGDGPETSGDIVAVVEDSLNTTRRIGNLSLEGYVLSMGSELALASYDPTVLAKAEPWARRAYAVAARLDDPENQAWALGNLGAAMLLTGSMPESAAASLRESIALARKIGDHEMQVESLLRLAAVERSRGNMPIAAALYRAWQSVGDTDERALTPSNQRIWHTFLRDLSGGDQDAQGTGMSIPRTLADAVAMALRDHPIRTQASGGNSARTPHEPA